ncbi:MAG: MATE family efflux transporter [Gemmatimonadaceae bacterium]
MTASSTPRLDALVGTRRLSANVLISLAGWVIPAAVALAALPIGARQWGGARFAIVSLAWGLTGWFGQFDFGIGRGLTRAVAARHASGRDAEIPAIVWSAHAALALLALIMAAALWMQAPHLVQRVLQVPATLADDAVRSIRWMSLGILPIVWGTASRAVLEARQQFRLATALRMPAVIGTYALPLLATTAADAVLLMVAVRTLYAIVQLVAMRVPLARPNAMGAVLRDGGWITLSAVISPFLVQGDRFALASWWPIAATGGYTAVQEVANKLAFFCVALQPVLFAAVSAARSVNEGAARAIARRALLATAAIVALPVLVLMVWSAPLLHLWLRDAYDPVAAQAMPVMALGVFANALAQVPFAWLQAGRGDRAVALLHLAELPLFLGALWYAVPRWGVPAAAAVWSGRLMLDGAALWWLSARARGDAERLTAERQATG